MMDAARAELTDHQIQALDVSDVGLGELTADQVGALSVGQIRSLAFTEFQFLTGIQSSHLTSVQIATIPDGWWFSRMSEEARAALNPEQVQSLDTSHVAIKHLNEGRRRFLSADQIQSLGYNDFPYLSAEQVVHLTSRQMSSIPSQWHFLNMSDAARAALSREQLLSLSPKLLAELSGQPTPTDNSESQSPAHEDGHNHVGAEAAIDQHDHDDGLPHPDDTAKRTEHLGLLDLVPHDSATHFTITSGNWSEATTWNDGEIPNIGSDVIVSANTTIYYDVVSTDTLHTVRVDGTLQFATDIDTQLKLDTLIIDTNGILRVGTTDQPVNSGVTARIVIDGEGAIDTQWDPLQLSRGLISHGQVEMAGEEVTPFVALADEPRAGDRQLILSKIPTHWRPSDELVLTGTRAGMSRNQDEELEILSIDENILILVDPLQYDHVTPAGYDLSVYVANMNRNVVVLSENPEMNSERGHVMFMHNQNVQVHNVGFYGLGRHDKRNPANDPVLDDGVLVEGTGLNPRGRYSVHFHRAGTTYEDTPGHVTGSAVVDSPGWGYVNHESYVIMEENVAYNVVGASFVTENGNEIGAFRGNLSIHTTGSGDSLESREDIFDFGHNGHGFWMQGPGVEVEDNISVGNNDSAFIFFTRSSQAQFDAANLDDPALAGGRDEVPVGMVPLRLVNNNTAFASKTGLETWFHMTRMNDGQSYIDNFTSWNTSRAGIHAPYTGQTTIRDAVIVGNVENPRHTGISRNDVTNNMTYDHVHVAGFEVGISVPVNRATVIDGGSFQTVHAIEIDGAHDSIRTVDIGGNLQFATLNEDQLRGRDQFDIFMDSDIDLMNRDIGTLFTPDIVRLGTVRLNGQQVYYHKQAADFIPFPVHDSPDFIPSELLGKTNREIWEAYGIAPAGIVAPSEAIGVDRINGLVGPQSDYLPALELTSAKYTNQLGDYELVYHDGAGDLIHDPIPVQLRAGWNLVTRQVDGETRTFFIFGDIRLPSFQVSARTPLIVNPAALELGFILRGTITDDSFGEMQFKKTFHDLESREIFIRDDGTVYLLLDFQVKDLAGNAVDISLELTLDPEAPFVQGTGQRDLSERELPTILLNLIRQYLIISQLE